MKMFKWWTTCFILLAFALIIFLLFFAVDIQSILKLNVQVTEALKNSVGIIGWIFGGIMSLLGFVTLFIAFSYENRLLEASKIKQQILLPYSLTLEEIIQKFNEYKLYINKDFLLNIIYWIFIVVSSTSILVWGIIIGLYTQFEFSLTFSNLINYILLSVWILFSLFLLSISIMINLIRYNKDPLGKGYMRNENEITDIESLRKNKGDLHELFYKISPTIFVLKNPQAKDVISEKHELSIYFPLKLANIRFVILLYNTNHESDIAIRVFGYLKELNRTGESFSHIITNDEVNISNLINDKSTGIIKFFDKDNNLLSLLKLQSEKIEDGFVIKSTKKMDLKLITRDNDFKDIEGVEREFISYIIS